MYEGQCWEFTKWPIAVESECKRYTFDMTDGIDKTHIVFTKERWPGVPLIPGTAQTEDGNINMRRGSILHWESTESKPNKSRRCIYK
jgi:hypothetical protein